MNKEFLGVESIRDNAILLAEKICSDNFFPTVIYVGLRGGATLGNVISEYFKLLAPPSRPPLYAAVVAHSYEVLESTQRVHIDGWTYHPKFLRRSDKVLLIDDIFDSGLTINTIADSILQRGILKNNLKIAVHDYKERLYAPQNHKHVPNYYSRKFVIEKPEDDNWIHYLSHELDGLSFEELRAHYSDKIIPSIENLLRIRKNNLTQKN